MKQEGESDGGRNHLHGRSVEGGAGGGARRPDDGAHGEGPRRMHRVRAGDSLQSVREHLPVRSDHDRRSDHKSAAPGRR